MSVRENLIKAKALISDPEKWAKGAFEFRGCYCALGALGRAESGFPAGYSIAGMRALRKGLPAHYDSVPAFNDKPSTSHEDIMTMFDRAIELAGRE